MQTCLLCAQFPLSNNEHLFKKFIYVCVCVCVCVQYSESVAESFLSQTLLI